jgi:hypothetical protein
MSNRMSPRWTSCPRDPGPPSMSEVQITVNERLWTSLPSGIAFTAQQLQTSVKSQTW